MEEQSLYHKDIWNSVFNCLIIYQKVIDAINYYEIKCISEDLNQNLREVLTDILYALVGEAIIAANDLLVDENSPINNHKIKNKIKNEKLEKYFKEGLIQKIENWDGLYKKGKHYPVLTDKNSGIAFFRDKVFAHTDNEGLFHDVPKEIIDNLKEVIMDLYTLYRELLIELSDKDDSKEMIAKTQPTSEDYFNKSKEKAALLKKLFCLELN